MSNVFADYTEEQRQQAVRDGLDLTVCDGMTGLWFKPCCGRFTCLESATPYGSPECIEARADGYCMYNPQPREQA